MRLISYAVGDGPSIELGRGVVILGSHNRLAPAVAGFLLFDEDSDELPRKGAVSLEFVLALDERTYRVRRSREKIEDWTVVDGENGYPAATGPEQVMDWVHRHFRIAAEVELRHLFREAAYFSLPASLSLLRDEPSFREGKFAQLLRLDRYATALRRVDGVIARADVASYRVALDVQRLVGESSWLEDRRERLAGARQLLDGIEKQSEGLKRDLALAHERGQQLAEIRAEWSSVQAEIKDLQFSLAATDVDTEYCRARAAQLDQAEARLASLEPAFLGFRKALDEIRVADVAMAERAHLQEQLNRVIGEVATAQGAAMSLESELAWVREASATSKVLEEGLARQEVLERQIAAATDRTVRLTNVTHNMQEALTESKRIEVQVTEMDRRLEELERSSAQAQRIRSIEDELVGIETRLRDVSNDADQLHNVQTSAAAAALQYEQLRKSVAMTDRVAAVVAGGGGAEERNLVAHLRDAIVQQMDAMDAQIQAWQRRARELASSPQVAAQLQATLRSLQEELVAAREADRRLATAGALRQERKHLQERLEQLRQAITGFAREQQECSAAPAQLADLRRELAALADPRAELMALKTVVARRDTLESDLRQARRRLDEWLKKQRELEQAVGSSSNLAASVAAAEARQDENREQHNAYLGEEAVIASLATARDDLAAVEKKQAAERERLAAAETRAASLTAAASQLEPAALSPQLELDLALVEGQRAERQQMVDDLAADTARLEGSEARLMQRRGDMERLNKTRELILFGRSKLVELEELLGGRVQADVAALATRFLAHLLDDPSARLSWPWKGSVELTRAGQSLSLPQLAPAEQACCGLAFRLALIRNVSNLRSAFVEGLTLYDRRADIINRLRRLPDFDQIFVPSQWGN